MPPKSWSPSKVQVALTLPTPLMPCDNFPQLSAQWEGYRAGPQREASSITCNQRQQKGW